MWYFSVKLLLRNYEKKYQKQSEVSHEQIRGQKYLVIAPMLDFLNKSDGPDVLYNLLEAQGRIGFLARPALTYVVRHRGARNDTKGH